MKTRYLQKAKNFFCRVLLLVAALAAMLLLSAMAQGALGLGTGLLAGLALLWVSNQLCGALLPPQRLRVKARARRVRPARRTARPALRVVPGGGRVA